jgi:hypothetical protein
METTTIERLILSRVHIMAALGEAVAFLDTALALALPEATLPACVEQKVLAQDRRERALQ